MIQNLPLDLFWWLTLETLAVLLGLKIISLRIKVDFQSDLLKILLAFGLGLAFLSCFVFLLACFQAVYPIVLVGSVLLLLALNLKGAVSFFYMIQGHFKRFSASEFSRFELILIGIFVLAAISNFLYCYTPPTQGREMMYNLTLPKIWLRDHKIAGLYDSHPLHYPFLLEMVYTLAMGIRGPVVAKLIHFSLGIFSSLLVYEITRIFINPRAALLSACIVYLMPLAIGISGTANVEFGMLYYGLLASYCLLMWMRNQNSTTWLILGGLMSGWSWLAKITGLPLIPSMIVFILIESLFIRKTQIIGALKSAGIFGFFSVVGCSPWLLKNFYFTGNPVFPFPVYFLGWQGHETAILEMASHFVVKINLSIWEMIKLHNNILIGDVLFGPGPLVFAFALPGLLLFRNKNTSAIFFMSILFFIFYTVLFNSIFHRFHDTRYYILMYTLLGILAAQGIENLKVFFRPTRINSLVVLGLMIPGLLLSLVFGLTKLPVFFGFESVDQYLNRKTFQYDLVTSINRLLDSNTKILVLGGEPSRFYFKSEIILPPVYIYKVNDPLIVLKGLRKIGATHVLIFDKLYSRREGDNILYHPDDAALDLHWDLEHLRASRTFQEIYRNDKAVLYQVSYLLPSGNGAGSEYSRLLNF